MKLSPKYISFLTNDARVEFLEGTTYAGKTTIAAGVKFMMKVASSDKKTHILAGLDLGTIEKNVINKELGLMEIYGDKAEGGLLEYNSKGKGKINLPHILYNTPRGQKIIYVLGYDNKSRWKKALGGQYGCLYIDELNIADMEFVREASIRYDYWLATLNPDDPNLPIYKEYINCARPLEEWKQDTPIELLEQLNQPRKKGWVHWYFTFNDNLGLTEEKKAQIIENLSPGSKIYKNKIKGLRGKATGLAFKYAKENIITREQAKKYKFKYFSVGVDTSYSKKTHDKLTFVLTGITTNNKCIILKTRSMNNKDRTIPFAPSDVIPLLIQFLEECKVEWGFVKTTYIDSADAGTIAEAQKTKRTTGCIYDFVGAWKKTTNITRVQLQRTWLHTLDFLIVDECQDYIDEMDIYSFNVDGTLEDGNDHLIQGGQYGWLPYKKYIGNWEVVKQLIKEADKEEVN